MLLLYCIFYFNTRLCNGLRAFF